MEMKICVLLMGEETGMLGFGNWICISEKQSEDSRLLVRFPENSLYLYVTPPSISYIKT